MHWQGAGGWEHESHAPSSPGRSVLQGSLPVNPVAAACQRDLASYYPPLLGIQSEEEALLKAVADVLRGGLPSSWSLQITEDGETAYFWNNVSEESRWTHPDHEIFTSVADQYRQALQEPQTPAEAFRQAWQKAAAAADEEKRAQEWSGPFLTEEGWRYWHSARTDESVWEDPEAESSRRQGVRSRLVLSLLPTLTTLQLSLVGPQSQAALPAPPRRPPPGQAPGQAAEAASRQDPSKWQLPAVSTARDDDTPAQILESGAVPGTPGPPPGPPPASHKSAEAASREAKKLLDPKRGKDADNFSPKVSMRTDSTRPETEPPATPQSETAYEGADSMLLTPLGGNSSLRGLLEDDGGDEEDEDDEDSDNDEALQHQRAEQDLLHQVCQRAEQDMLLQEKDRELEEARQALARAVADQERAQTQAEEACLRAQQMEAEAVAHQRYQAKLLQEKEQQIQEAKLALQCATVEPQLAQSHAEQEPGQTRLQQPHAEGLPEPVVENGRLGCSKQAAQEMHQKKKPQQSEESSSEHLQKNRHQTKPQQSEESPSEEEAFSSSVVASELPAPASEAVRGTVTDTTLAPEVRIKILEARMSALAETAPQGVEAGARETLEAATLDASQYPSPQVESEAMASEALPKAAPNSVLAPTTDLQEEQQQPREEHKATQVLAALPATEEAETTAAVVQQRQPEQPQQLGQQLLQHQQQPPPQHQEQQPPQEIQMPQEQKPQQHRLPRASAAAVASPALVYDGLTGLLIPAPKAAQQPEQTLPLETGGKEQELMFTPVKALGPGGMEEEEEEESLSWLATPEKLSHEAKRLAPGEEFAEPDFEAQLQDMEAVKLQRAWRAKQEQRLRSEQFRALQRRRAAATYQLQRWWRGCVERKELKAAGKELLVSLCAQRLEEDRQRQRIEAERQATLEAAQAALEAAQATRIQSCWRAQIARQEMSRKREEHRALRVAQAEHLKRCLQGCVASYDARRKLEKLRAKRALKRASQERERLRAAEELRAVIEDAEAALAARPVLAAQLPPDPMAELTSSKGSSKTRAPLSGTERRRHRQRPKVVSESQLLGNSLDTDELLDHLLTRRDDEMEKPRAATRAETKPVEPDVQRQQQPAALDDEVSPEGGGFRGGEEEDVVLPGGDWDSCLDKAFEDLFFDGPASSDGCSLSPSVSRRRRAQEPQRHRKNPASIATSGDCSSPEAPRVQPTKRSSGFSQDKPRRRRRREEFLIPEDSDPPGEQYCSASASSSITEDLLSSPSTSHRPPSATRHGRTERPRQRLQDEDAPGIPRHRLQEDDASLMVETMSGFGGSKKTRTDHHARPQARPGRSSRSRLAGVAAKTLHQEDPAAAFMSFDASPPPSPLLGGGGAGPKKILTAKELLSGGSLQAVLAKDNLPSPTPAAAAAAARQAQTPLQGSRSCAQLPSELSPLWPRHEVPWPDAAAAPKAFGDVQEQEASLRPGTSGLNPPPSRATSQQKMMGMSLRHAGNWLTHGRSSSNVQLAPLPVL